MKGTDRYMKMLIAAFWKKKKIIRGNLIFLDHFLLFDWAWSKLSQATITIRSLGQSGHDFFHDYY